MSVMASRPLLRWAIPGAALVIALGSGVAVNAMRASAGTTLPPRTPAQLLADVASARLDAGSGTVVETADLGLPVLPGGAGGQGSSDLSSLMTGSHTLRVWFSGPDKSRVALLGALGESDVIRNGTDVWVWSSAKNTAQHTVLPGKQDGHPQAPPTAVPSTPQQAADQILAALDPTTAVSTGDTTTVAGRAAYDLVLHPKSADTLIGSVRIAIDGQRHVPLRVQVYPRSSDSAAFEIGFKQVSFTRPGDDLFAFTPPAGVKVSENTAVPGTTSTSRARLAVLGTGWSSVLAVRPAPHGGSEAGGPTGTLQALLDRLPKVSGTWGSGRLLSGTLFTALLTDDGRVLVGAVPAERLLAAAGDPAAALK